MWTNLISFILIFKYIAEVKQETLPVTNGCKHCPTANQGISSSWRMEKTPSYWPMRTLNLEDNLWKTSMLRFKLSFPPKLPLEVRVGHLLFAYPNNLTNSAPNSSKVYQARTANSLEFFLETKLWIPTAQATQGPVIAICVASPPAKSGLTGWNWSLETTIHQPNIGGWWFEPWKEHEPIANSNWYPRKSCIFADLMKSPSPCGLHRSLAVRLKTSNRLIFLGKGSIARTKWAKKLQVPTRNESISSVSWINILEQSSSSRGTSCYSPSHPHLFLSVKSRWQGMKQAQFERTPLVVIRLAMKLFHDPNGCFKHNSPVDMNSFQP